MSDSLRYKIVLWMVWVQIALLPVICIRMAASGVKDGLHTPKIRKMISAMNLESGNITTVRVTAIENSGIINKTAN